MIDTAPSDEVPIRKKRGPKPTGKTPQIAVRLDPEITAVLDRVVAESDDLVTRSDVVRLILKEWMKRNQLLEEKT